MKQLLIIFTLLLSYCTSFTMHRSALIKNNDSHLFTFNHFLKTQCTFLCGICLDPYYLTKINVTKCCHQVICQEDLDRLQKDAKDLYNNLHNPEWRRNYSRRPDFTGWPEKKEHATCPYCRAYPLELSLQAIPLPKQPAPRKGSTTEPYTTATSSSFDRKKAQEAATLRWLQENTKKCPNKKCAFRITKELGDNRRKINCPRCHERFCWECNKYIQECRCF